MNISCKKIINRFLKFFMISRIRTTEKVVYLTFDDGPEPGITEFILNELNKYGFYATFFCCGKNVQQNPTLYNKIILNKHSVGSHTYNHLDGFKTPSKEYLDDEDAITLEKNDAFANNYQLSSIDVFSNSISIDIDAFYNNKSLQFVTFKEHMENGFALNYDAFSGCNNLRYIVFEKGITFEQFKQSITNYILTYKIAIPTTNYINISSCLENAIQYDFFNDNYIQLSDMN